MKALKITIPLFLAVLLRVANLYCAEPELWVVPLEKKIPFSTPKGQMVNSLAFVLRVRGNGPYEAVNLYGAIKFRLYDSKGRAYITNYERIVSLPPTITDILPLKRDETSQRCYSAWMRGDSLVVQDGTGGVYQFLGVKIGKARLEVIFDSTGVRNKAILDFERVYDGGREGGFYKGPMKCGSFVIDIRSIPKVEPQDDLGKPRQDPNQSIPGL